MISSRRDQRAETTLTVRISAGRGGRDSTEFSDREDNEHDREGPSRHDLKKHRDKRRKKQEKKERKKKEEKKRKKDKAEDEEEDEYNESDENESPDEDEEKSRKKKKRHLEEEERTAPPPPRRRPADDEYNSAEDSEGSLKDFIVDDDKYDPSVEEDIHEQMYGYYSEGSWGESEEEDEQRDPDQDLRDNRDEFIATRSQRLRRRGHHVNLLDQDELDPLDINLLEVQVSINQREAQRRRRTANQARESIAPAAAAPSSSDSSKKKKAENKPPGGPKLVPDPWREGEEPERTKEEEEQGVPLCVICQGNAAKCIFVPCGQKVICVTCSQEYHKFFAAGKVQCPACKKDSSMILRVYE